MTDMGAALFVTMIAMVLVILVVAVNITLHFNDKHKELIDEIRKLKEKE
jgi:hypothetical protein